MIVFVSLLYKSINEYKQMKQNKALDVQGMVYKSILESIWIRATKKMFQMQKKYSMKIEPQEALVLFEEYTGQFEEDLYTRSFMQPFCDYIHKTLICSPF
ncbi:hypothetical protein E3E36_11870 [Thermococcus sp. M36]|jgi:hypothetical protein|uniref:hypothetical protein n=1 Tax=Thermococcus sp. M36 TaxID=1638261 RepID=UPI00143A0007|nr:hypothetical protein [Thermococcus sp. M36]NJE06818.1 hypothetical protein [Thermococcus sp. M36]